jgi:hypothetical protein
MKLDYLETHLVDHCNLNCKGCSHFSSLSEKKFIDFISFQRDLQRLGELFDDISTIRLMGGEPLLHPDVNKFLDCARSIFPNSRICLVTNGMLLGRQPESFWEAIRRNDILIQVTRYPINLDVEAIKIEAEKFQSTLVISELITSFNKFINASGDSDPAISFNECQALYRCPNLRDGKIYVCSFASLVHIFNNFFKKKIPVTRTDCINIHDNINGGDIIDFLNRPIPMCKWCLHDRPLFKWGISKKEIGEWSGDNPSMIAHFFKTICDKSINSLKRTVADARIIFVKFKRVMRSKSIGSITADPNPIRLCKDINIITVLSWTSSRTDKVEVHVNAPDGPLLARSGPSGKAVTGNWVRNGTIFYLQDVTECLPLTPENTLDRVRVGVKKAKQPKRQKDIMPSGVK